MEIGEFSERPEAEAGVEVAEEVAESAGGAEVSCSGDLGELRDPEWSESVEERCNVVDAAAAVGVLDEVDRGELTGGESERCVRVVVLLDADVVGGVAALVEPKLGGAEVAVGDVAVDHDLERLRCCGLDCAVQLCG